MKKFSLIMAGVLMTLAVITGCDNKASLDNFEDINNVIVDEEDQTTDIDVEDKDVEEKNVNENVLPDGEYVAVFNTDSTMFHVNEAYDGKGTLTVKNGEMSIHISLPSKSILNLYYGLAEDAMKEGAVLLEPTTDTVTYSDGLTEEVHGFDIPVPYLDREFDVALIGTKGKWYDHKVSVSLVSEEEADDSKVDLEDGEYTIDVELQGGTGKASITSPAKISVKDGKVIATVEWSSPNYDYMIVGETKYLPVNTEGNSVFEIPVDINNPNEVTADTVAMSTPHEIQYTLIFNKETVQPVNVN